MKLGSPMTIPNALQFIASEIPSASIRAFCEGSTLSPPTAPNAFTSPIVVPSAPDIADAAMTTAIAFVRSGNSFLRFQRRCKNHMAAPAPRKPSSNQIQRNAEPNMPQLSGTDSRLSAGPRRFWRCRSMPFAGRLAIRFVGWDEVVLGERGRDPVSHRW